MREVLVLLLLLLLLCAVRRCVWRVWRVACGEWRDDDDGSRRGSVLASVDSSPLVRGSPLSLSSPPSIKS